MAPPSKHPNVKKSTGTVPKATACTASTARKSRTSDKSLVSSKNTEIVAPTRRELNDLNNYIFSVTESNKYQYSDGHSHIDGACFELENQRFCWPVRPIPRRKESTESAPVPAITANSSVPNFNQNTNPASGSAASTLNTATVGVVIPTTPNSVYVVDDNSNANRSSNCTTSAVGNLIETLGNTNSLASIENEIRYDLLQLILSLTSKPTNKTSESGRAQSVTSIQLSAPNTPTYEELQHKLDTSARNMQHIKDQQQQLLQMHHMAKQHLSDLESRKNQKNKQEISSTIPDYQSVEEVQNDMSNLVDRLKSLTTFIHQQNELSSSLGEDGPEILAEQLLLQKKLQELKSRKQEMHNLISELQQVNINAEQTIQSQQQVERLTTPTLYDGERIVPIELTGPARHRSEPIENSDRLGEHSTRNSINPSPNLNVTDRRDNCVNGFSENADKDIEEEANELLRQKFENINAMKDQLKRLKNMMDTVKMIENKTEGRNVKDIGIEPQEMPYLEPTIVNANSVDNSRTPTPTPSIVPEKDEIVPENQDQIMNEKVRLLHEMTEDLREQAVHLAEERDRLKVIKDAMNERRDLERMQQKSNDVNSITKGVINLQSGKDMEKMLLKAEYESKKKEFEKICQRLQDEDLLIEKSKQNLNDIKTDEPGDLGVRVEDNPSTNEHNNDLCCGGNWSQGHVLSPGSSIQGSKAGIPTPSRGKESTDSGAADIHGTGSLEASFQSGSTRSFSMPPPMRAINTRETPWRKNSHDNPHLPYENYPASHPPPLPSWNPNYYYSLPYAQQFNPHCHHSIASTNSAATDYFCTHSFNSNVIAPGSSSNVGAPTQQHVPTGQNATMISTDPVILQQFIQTQQMLINSVCQCNQLLWHQQKEINNLNNSIVMLQERLKNQSNNVGGLESNSMIGGGSAQANSLCANDRARSEPFKCSPVSQDYRIIYPQVSSSRQYQSYNCTNICQQHARSTAAANNIQQADNYHSVSNVNYNYGRDGQRQQSCSNTNLTQETNSFLNNDMPNTANYNHQSAPPIFMHHHNNTMSATNSNASTNAYVPHTNNNSNILNSQQNCLSSPRANVLQSGMPNASLVSNSSNTNAAAAAAALNNQVPPGNRANNYWDNFRSYSRQNLLSTHSCKSNEEQSQQQQTSVSPFGVNSLTNNTTNNNSNPLRNVPQQNMSSSFNSSMGTNNMAQHAYDNKYIHTFRNQFSNIGNSYLEEQQYAAQSALGNCLGNDSSAVSAAGAGEMGQPFSPENHENLENHENIVHHENSDQSTLTDANVTSSTTDNPELRNINLDSVMNEPKKKFLLKTSCNAKRSKPQPQSNSKSSIETDNNETSGNNHIWEASRFRESENQTDVEATANVEDNLSPGNEMKRNLLANALKNDKFTTKLFESLKDDIYREVYSIIQATDSHPHYLLQLFKELQLISSNDPLRNIVMKAMHDLYKSSRINSSDLCAGSDADALHSNNSSGAFGLDQSMQMKGAMAMDSKASSIIGDEAEGTCSVLEDIIKSQDQKRTACKVLSDTVALTKNESKTDYQCDSTVIVENSKQQESMRSNQKLLNYVMNSIRNGISETEIDDLCMSRIARLTVSAIEKFTSGNDALGYTLSPPDLYTAMRMFAARERETFLAHYEAYLNSVFLNKPLSNSELIEPFNLNISQKLRDNSRSEADEKRNRAKSEEPPTSALVNSSISMVNYSEPSELSNSISNSQPPDLITTSDVGLAFGISSNSPYGSGNQSATSTSTTIVDQDLAESDQICIVRAELKDPLSEHDIASSLISEYFNEYRTDRNPGGDNCSELCASNIPLQNYNTCSNSGLRAEEHLEFVDRGQSSMMGKFSISNRLSNDMNTSNGIVPLGGGTLNCAINDNVSQHHTKAITSTPTLNKESVIFQHQLTNSNTNVPNCLENNTFLSDHIIAASKRQKSAP